MAWRLDLFNQPPESDPVMVDLQEATYKLDPLETLAHVNRALVDPEIHTLFNPRKIGIGLNIMFSNFCSEIPFAYVKDDGIRGNEAVKVAAIGNLHYLYSNYFNRYCTGEVNKIGEIDPDNRIEYLCYMFWDIFVLYPGNATEAMKETAIGVMRKAINNDNEHCLVSAIHGLGHWASDTELAQLVLEEWLVCPTTQNQEIIQYAKQAMTGCIQ